MKMDEDSIFNKLIVMDDVLGLADKSANFTNFLTVMRKFNFTCVNAFHTIYLTRSNWQMILSQTKNVTFFLALYKLDQRLTFYFLTVIDAPTKHSIQTFG